MNTYEITFQVEDGVSTKFLKRTVKAKDVYQACDRADALGKKIADAEHVDERDVRSKLIRWIP